jgi:hypothetical protein
MRWYVSIGAALIAAGLAGGDVASVAAPGAPQFAQKSADAQVDVELVLAVDVSYSMDLEELAIQREGYAQAVTSPEFLNALKSGPHGKVAVTYFEWAASHDQKIVIPWRIIDGPESADAVAAEIMKAPLRRASRTSISGAINFGMQVLGDNPFKGIRRVIDISGDGPNNDGEPVLIARDAALAKGVTINGLPVMIKQTTSMDIEKLDIYYEDCVIGGAGSFVIPIKERVKFKEAIRTKLILEIAGLQPQGALVPVQSQQPRIPCTIGEQLRRQRWGP